MLRKLKVATWSIRQLAESKHKPKLQTYNILRTLHEPVREQHRSPIPENKSGGDRGVVQNLWDKVHMYFSSVGEEEQNHHGLALVHGLSRPIGRVYIDTSFSLVSIQFYLVSLVSIQFSL